MANNQAKNGVGLGYDGSDSVLMVMVVMVVMEVMVLVHVVATPRADVSTSLERLC